MKILENKRLHEKIYTFRDKSGLTICVMPKVGHSKTFAIFATKYGSIDSKFREKNQNNWIEVPDGIAHFLEHKLFEKKYGDIFSKYAALGASANAYTSFNQTAYLFSCTDHFKESLKVLLELVTKPYFTAETVQKEQGIIGQEIRMGLDSPGRKVMYSLLECLYHDHPVQKEIAGSEESITRITHILLYKCYEMFYNPENMVLFVAGDVKPQDVADIVGDYGIESTGKDIERGYSSDKAGVVKSYVENKMEVATPLFYIGVKDMRCDCTGKECAKIRLETDILIEILTGEGSELYADLYSDGYINSDFSYEYYGGHTFGMTLICGESKEPKKVLEYYQKAVDKLKVKGIAEEDFNRAKKVIYGRFIRSFDDTDSIACNFVELWAGGVHLFDMSDAFEDVTLESVAERLHEHFVVENTALSVVSPMA